MCIDPKGVWNDIQAIRKLSPLIHNITNYVVMEKTANCLLAVGSSPVMAHAIEEVEEMARMAHALVLNIGTLSAHWIQSMRLALKAANTKQIPVVLDPVGSGSTPFRTKVALSLLKEGKMTAIRGNASEIASLVETKQATKGVDSLFNPLDCISEAKRLSINNGIVWMSGQTDVVTNGHDCFLIQNGHPLMSKVTGMGCAATAITGAFLAVNCNPLLGCVHAAILMGIAGELAAEKAKGPGAFAIDFIDALYHITARKIEKLMKVKAL